MNISASVNERELQIMNEEYELQHKIATGSNNSNVQAAQDIVFFDDTSN